MPFPGIHWTKTPKRDEIIKRMSDTRKGVKKSDEFVRHMSESRKGQAPKNWKSIEGMRRGTGRKFICVGCGKEFQSSGNGRRKNSKYCNRACFYQHRKPPWLGKHNLKMTGENHPRWKGGVANENRKVRLSLEYKIWRKAVFERDNYTCQMCNRRGEKLNAHHIKPFSTHPELRLEISNGKTLCKKCHQSLGKHAD